MIKTLEIQNFQSHKHSKLEFSEGVNIITGTSDSGKSAIIRALRWLIWNRPNGDEFRSDWGGETSVSIETNANFVKRTKDKNENHYYLNQAPEQEIDFSAFKTEIPKEIQLALNLNEINLQQQLDSPFLLTNSPGEVAQHFNQIAHLDNIDLGLRNVQSWIDHINSVIGKKKQKEKPATGLIKQLEDYEIQLTQFDHLEKFEIELEILEQMQVKMVRGINSKSKLSQLFDSLLLINTQIQTQTKLLKPEIEINALLILYEKKKGVIIKQNTLIELIDEIGVLNEKTTQLIQLTQLDPILNQTISFIKKREDKQFYINKLSRITQNLINQNNNCIIIKKEMVKNIDLFNQAFPNICPLCGKPKEITNAY